MNNKLIYELMKNNKGLTSDDPIIIICPTCNCIAESGEQRTWSGYCGFCNYWFPYTYILDRWYYSKYPINTYIIKYIGSPKQWEYDTMINVNNLSKLLWNKYKNTEYEHLIVSELLGQDEQ